MAVAIKNQFPPLAAFTYTTVAADASADYVKFNYPGYVHGAIAQVFAAAGTENMTGLDVDITPSTASSEIKVAVTAITAGDIINLIIW